MSVQSITFSVVILSFNSERYIRQCLESALDTFEAMSATYEVVVVDNGSKDQSKKIIIEVAEQRSANIRLIDLATNTGTTYSRNCALRQCIGEYILVIDSDAYINAEAVSHLRSYLEQHSECGLAVPKLIYPDGRYQISTDVFPTFIHKLKRFFFLKKMEINSSPPDDGVCAVDYAISAFWMFPKSTLQRVGYLDEKIFYSPEDVDYCIRIWKQDLSINYLPAVTVIHDAQEISRSKGIKINWFTLSHAKGLLYLFFKHRYFFSGDKFRKSVCSR